MSTDWVHPAAMPPERILADCQTRQLRRGGPGGQHRNKVETAVRLVHRPTGVDAEASERRSQAENRARALFRLRLNLALHVRHPAGADYRPSSVWQSRCQAGRVCLSPTHHDFPTMLAEALDVLEGRALDPRAAAETLGCTTSQLIRLLKREPRAVHQLNQKRQEQGLRPLQ
jgi:hypothetical protein